MVGSPCTLAPDSPGFFSSCWSKARSGDSSGKKQLCGRFAHEGLWLNHLTASPFRWHKQTRFSHAAVPSTAAPVLPRRSFPPSRGSGLWENPAESPGLSRTPKCLVQGPGELLNQRWLRGQKLPQTVSCSVQRKTAWFVPREPGTRGLCPRAHCTIARSPPARDSEASHRAPVIESFVFAVVG